MRDEMGVTQDELAHHSGLNRNYVGMFERCETAPNVDVIKKLAQALSLLRNQSISSSWSRMSLVQREQADEDVLTIDLSSVPISARNYPLVARERRSAMLA